MPFFPNCCFENKSFCNRRRPPKFYIIWTRFSVFLFNCSKILFLFWKLKSFFSSVAPPSEIFTQFLLFPLLFSQCEVPLTKFEFCVMQNNSLLYFRHLSEMIMTWNLNKCSKNRFQTHETIIGAIERILNFHKIRIIRWERVWWKIKVRFYSETFFE